MKEKIMMRIKTLNELLEENGKNFKVEYVQHWKINKELEGYAILKQDSDVSPVIDNDDNIMQMSDEELIEYMENILEKDQPTLEDVKNIMKNKDYVKENLYMNLISLPINIEKLKKEDISFIPIEDMVITFYVHIEFGGNIGKIRMRNSLFKALNLTKEEAFLYAKENLEKNYNIVDIEEIIKERFGYDASQEETHSEVRMLVVTTKDKDEGAALMLIEKVMKELAEHFSSKFLILPSSIHEFIAVPYTTQNDINSCKKIVHEVNSLVLSPDEYLSDNVFVWENGELHKA